MWNAPLTLSNFTEAWKAAPFALYFLNTVILITTVLVANLILCTLVAYAFVRYRFRWAGILFGLVMVQLLISPEILIVENHLTLSTIGMTDTIIGIAPALFDLGLRDLSFAADFHDRPEVIGRGCADRGGERLVGPLDGLCPAGAPGLSGLRACLDQFPLQ